MINNLHINGVHTEVTDDMRQYVQKKIGNLDKFMPRNARESASIDVKLKEAKAQNKQSFECELIVKLPHATLTVHRKATTVLAAIDEAEANLKNQLKRYKDTHNPSRVQRHVIARFRRSTKPAQLS